MVKTLLKLPAAPKEDAADALAAAVCATVHSSRSLQQASRHGPAAVGSSALG